MTMLLGSDGLEYEDLKARLLGKPAPSFHNKKVIACRQTGKEEEWIRDWSRSYRWSIARDETRAAAHDIAIACADARARDRWDATAARS